MITQMLEMLLPHACDWAEQQERIVLKSGVPLNESQLADAKQIGVSHPELVRLLAFEELPMPANPLLLQAVDATGLLSPLTDGLTLRYGILIREGLLGNSRLIAHELVHTKQYEQHGGFEGFLRSYLLECITPPGYPHGPMEQEAVKTAEKMYPR
jgi:hypothetical protein